MVQVDQSRCIGCGMCAAAAPGVFQIAGTASTVIAQPEDRAARGQVFDAANGCPVNAISL